MEIGQGDRERLTSDMRQAIIAPLKLASKRLGEPHRGGTDQKFSDVLGRTGRLRIDMIVANRRVCRYRLNPSLTATTIFDPEVWGWMRLRYEHTLLPETSEQVGLPESGVEVTGLTISCPVLIRVGQREVNPCHYP